MNLYAPCSFCGGRVAEAAVQKPVWWGKELKFLMEKVPSGVCAQCGEIFYKIETLRSLEKLTPENSKKKTVKKIPVVSYGSARAGAYERSPKTARRPGGGAK